MDARFRFALLVAVGALLRPAPAPAAWTPGVELRVCYGSANLSNPSVTTDGAGGAIVSWFDGRALGWELRAQHVLAAGQIDPAWTLANGNSGGTLVRGALDLFPRSDPAVAVPDGSGGAIFAWVDYRNGQQNTDLYAQHVLASGFVDPAWTAANGNADGTPLCRAAGSQSRPGIIPDGAGGAVVTWVDQRDGYDNVFAQHVLASGVVDPAWTAANGDENGTRLCRAAGSQGAPCIVADGAGGAIVAWRDYRLSASYGDIYAQRVLASGVVDPAWTAANGNADGTRLFGTADLLAAPAIVSDGVGGAIVTWHDSRDFTSQDDIYAQHVLSSGIVDPAWTAANGNARGTRLCHATLSQRNPRIVPDGAGGAIVAWEDSRDSTTNVRIYAQHVQAAGFVDPAWTAAAGDADGTLLCSRGRGIQGLVVVEDGAGGAMAVWQDFRNDSTKGDLYAQHVLGAGTVDPEWGDGGGIPLCVASNSQAAPGITADGTGGALVAWRDLRSNWKADLYAQHIPTSPCGQLPVHADFAGTPVSGAVPLTVHFTDLSTAQGRTITSRSWDFGDGATSTSTNPVHTFTSTEARSFTVRLTAVAGWCGNTRVREGYVTVTIPPPAPALSAPAAGAFGLPNDLMLRWRHVADATSYHVQVGTGSSFYELIVDAFVAGDTAYAVSLASDTKYFWRVSSVGPGGEGPFSAARYFVTTLVPPPAPTLVFPPNGTQNALVNQPMSWNAVSGATSYVLQVSASPSFTNPTGIAGIRDTTRAIGLGEYRTYYWRVGAVNLAGQGSFAAAWSFTTGARRTAPQPTSPGDYTTVYTQPETLAWRPVSDALSYRLRVSTNYAFTALLVDQPNLADTSFTVSLASGGKYYWRVSAMYDLGPGVESSIWSFDVWTSVPSAPLLLAPPNGARGVPPAGNLMWGMTGGAALCRLQLSEVPSFDPVLVDEVLAGPPFTLDLPDSTRVFWRVNAGNPLGTSPWSTAWSFTTGFRHNGGEGGPARAPTDWASGAVRDEVAPAFGVRLASPNPVAGDLALELALPRASATTLSVFDLAGRRVLERSFGHLGPGRHVVMLEEGRRLPNGVYVLRLTREDESASVRFVVLH